MNCRECDRPATFWCHHFASKKLSRYVCHQHMLLLSPLYWYRAPYEGIPTVEWERYSEAHDRESWRDRGRDAPLAP